MEKKQYEVLSPVEHEKKLYRIGKPIHLTDAEAEDLLAVKAIGRPHGEQLQPEAGADLVVVVDQARAEIVRLSQLLASRDEEVAEVSRKLEAADESLTQASEDIQSLQTAKAQAASALAELQAQNLETQRAKRQLDEEVAELQAKLAAATKPKKP